MIPVFVINLDRDTDRLKWMTAELGRVSLPFERLPGVLGRNVPATLTPYLAAALADPANTLKPEEIGCWASHLLALLAVVERHLPYALIFEDDVALSANFMSMIATIDELPVGWGMVRLAWISKRHTMPVAALTPEATLVQFSRLPLGAGAYLVSRTGAANILCAPLLGYEPIDLAWRSWWKYGLETYGVRPAPVIQNIFDVSSIESLGGRRGNFVHDRTSPVAFARNRLNRLRGMAAQIRFLGAARWAECALRNLTKTASAR